jgi:hypothetical protein
VTHSSQNDGQEVGISVNTDTDAHKQQGAKFRKLETARPNWKPMAG